MLDYTQWTREDWKAFDAARAAAFAPTQEEIAKQEYSRLQAMIVRTQQLLLKYNIIFTGQETDFTQLYTQYIKGEPDMKEWLGDTSRLDEILKYKIENENTIQEFCQFILQYEG